MWHAGVNDFNACFIFSWMSILAGKTKLESCTCLRTRVPRASIYFNGTKRIQNIPFLSNYTCRIYIFIVLKFIHNKISCRRWKIEFWCIIIFIIHTIIKTKIKHVLSLYVWFDSASVQNQRNLFSLSKFFFCLVNEHLSKRCI